MDLKFSLSSSILCSSSLNRLFSARASEESLECPISSVRQISKWRFWARPLKAEPSNLSPQTLKPKPQTGHFKLKPCSSILKLDILGFSLGAKARNWSPQALEWIIWSLSPRAETSTGPSRAQAYLIITRLSPGAQRSNLACQAQALEPRPFVDH